MTELEKRLRELLEQSGDIGREYPQHVPALLAEAARIGAEIERERIAANLDRFVGMGDKHGMVSCVALVRSAQRDIREHTEGNHRARGGASPTDGGGK